MRRPVLLGGLCAAFVVAVAFGNQNTLSEPVPYWNPLEWNVGYMLATLRSIVEGGTLLTVMLRTLLYVVVALTLATKRHRC